MKVLKLGPEIEGGHSYTRTQDQVPGLLHPKHRSGHDQVIQRTTTLKGVLVCERV